MERKLRYAWWVILVGLVIIAAWKLLLPHGTEAYVQKGDTSREIIVYVAGAVEKPGLVHLEPDARLNDALKQVSLLPEANLESMNPAEKLKDGQKVIVPFKVVIPEDSTAAGNSINAGSATAPPTPTAPAANSKPVAVPSTSGGKININTAGAAELDKLSGVGPALADRIIQYRMENGPFARPEDLENVSGIGPKTYEKMASQVTVGP